MRGFTRGFFAAAFLLSVVLFATAVSETEPDQRRTPLPYPFARGTLAALDLPAHTIGVNTDAGPQNFLLTPTTYIFRGKQKITPDQLKPGELVKLNYTTNELGQATARRIKVSP